MSDNTKKLHDAINQADAQKAKFDAACEEQWKARGAVVGKAIGNGIAFVGNLFIKGSDKLKKVVDEHDAKVKAKEQAKTDAIVRETISVLEEQIFPELKEEISKDCAKKLHDAIEAKKKAGYTVLKKN